MKQTAEEQIKELKQQLAMANEKIAQLTASRIVAMSFCEPRRCLN